MPALKLFGCGKNTRGFTTRPFAGDDLQIICALFGIYRIIQLACLLPFWVKLYLYRLHGQSLIGPDNIPLWCLHPLEAYEFSTEEVKDAYQENAKKYSTSMLVPFAFFLTVSMLYTFLDMGLSLAIWSAASVGTPTEPMGRDKALRSLILIKIIFMNLMIFLVLTSGIFLVSAGRKYNYGCGMINDNMIEEFESTAWYKMFSVAMVTYAFEFLLWPCILTNQISASIVYRYRRTAILENFLFHSKAGKIKEELPQKRDKNTEACLGWCCGFLRFLSCNRLGGGNIKAQSDLKDAAVAIMDFFNSDSNFDIVISDLVIAFKLLGRLHRERIYNLSQQAKSDERERTICFASNEGDSNADERLNHDDPEQALVDEICFSDETENLRLRAQSKDNLTTIGRTRRGYGDLLSVNISNKSFDFSKDHHDVSKKRLLGQTESDMRLIQQAARFSHYALGVYDIYPEALLATGRMDGGFKGLYHPSSDDSNLSLSNFFRMAELGLQDSLIAFASFRNDILATPYAIIVDELEHAVVVAIRGTASIEDLVTDLQLSPVSMERVKQVCNFDAPVEYFSHRGILTKCKWIYNDLHRRNILSRLLPSHADPDPRGGACRGFQLVFTGHSLGAGCAAILGTMYRPKYPDLQCFSYCPPGCTASIRLAKDCEEYVTSILVGNDIIPRVKVQNFEILRYECLLLLARVKMPKIIVWKDLRKPCQNEDLEARNKQLLYDKDEVPTHTPYFKELDSYRNKRLTIMNERFPPNIRLTIPGRIIHLIPKDRKKLNYLPYWECRDAFHELTINADAVGEHSMDKLVIILQNISAAYEVSLEGLNTLEDNEPYASSGSNNFNTLPSQAQITLDDRWFVLCARPPRGYSTFIPTFLALFGAGFSITGNNMCSLFFRKVIENGTQIDTADKFLGVTLGLFSYGAEFYSEDHSDVILRCALTPSTIDDLYVDLARGFSALALVVGIPLVALFFFANCMMFSDRAFRRISLCLFLVTFFQSLIFLFLKSNRCKQHLDFIPTTLEFETCRLDTGSRMALVASILWFMSAIFTLFFDSAVKVESRLASYSAQ